MKELVLGILVVFSNIAMVWVWSDKVAIVLNSEFREYTALVIPIFSMCVSGAIFSLGMLFIRNPNVGYTAAIIALGAPFLLFSASRVVMGALGLSIFLAIFSVYRTRKEYAISLKFSASKILKNSLPLYFTAVSLAISIFYLHQVDTKGATNPLLLRPALDYTLRLLAKNPSLFESIGIPAMGPDMTIDTALESFIREELKKQGIAGKKISPQELALLLAEQRSVLAKQYGIALRGDEKIADALSFAIEGSLSRMLGSYAEYLPFVSAAAFFLALKTLTLPLYYLTLLLAYILIKLLLYGKFFKREKEMVEVEKIKLA